MLFNQIRAREYLKRCGLDAVIATSPVNVLYCTDYSCWIDPLMRQFMAVPGGTTAQALNSFAVFDGDGAMGLVLHTAFAVNSADIWVKDVWPYGDLGFDRSLMQAEGVGDYRRFFESIEQRRSAAGPLEALSALLSARGLEGARIGIELEGLDPALVEGMRAALPGVQLRDASQMLRMIRMVKTEEEMRRLTRAAEINEAGAWAALSEARVGGSFPAMRQAFREAVAKQGADFDHYCIGPMGLGLATDTDYRLRSGDVLYVDFGCVYGRYFSDSGMSIALGAVPEAMTQRYAALLTSINAGQGALRAGVKASAIRAAMKGALEAIGVSASFPHGHGLGLELRDYPILVEDNGLRIKDGCIDMASDLELEADMVINLEAGMFMPGVGSLQIENSFRVTSVGCRELTPRRLEAIHQI